MKKQHQIVNGSEILKKYSLDHERIRGEIDGIYDKRYVVREVPIWLLREKDPELDAWFRNPLRRREDEVLPISAPKPGHLAPILIGTKNVNGQQHEDAVIDGFYRIAYALITGKEAIQAYVPENCSLMSEAIQFQQRLKVEPEQKTVPGEKIAREILDRHSKGWEADPHVGDTLNYAAVSSRNYVLREVPISLLRKQDVDLDNYLKNPAVKENITPLYPGYTPILIGTKRYGGPDIPDSVIDGFARTASAFHSGLKTIKAFIPEDSPLIRKILSRSKRLKL
ncbi:hypothetical protein [Chitinophaga japonensis]|nr:hypothetical protein [Chitinophaga japonensis]